MLDRLTKLAQQLDEIGLEEEADGVYNMIRGAGDDEESSPEPLSKDIASNNTINIIRVSLFSMGIKELLGFMGVMGAAFSWGKWGGMFKNMWGKLTGEEKEDTVDDKPLHGLLEGLSKEQLDQLALIIQENESLNSILNEATKDDIMSNNLPENLQEEYDSAVKDVIHDFMTSIKDEAPERVGDMV